MKRIAIIGAGIAGLTLAYQLQHKAEITLFEKSRGVSGRLATRRLGEFEFDHGAQFFTARSNAFKQFIAPFIKQGIIAPWQPRVLTLAPGKKPYRRDWFEPHYVAVPRMNSLAKALAGELDIELQTPISSLSAVSEGQWQLRTPDAEWPETFDWVISTAPVIQSIALLGEHLSAGILADDKALQDVMDNFRSMLSAMLKRMEDEGRPLLNLAFGCTGGRHRSVWAAESVGKWLREQGHHVTITHREIAVDE